VAAAPAAGQAFDTLPGGRQNPPAEEPFALSAAEKENPMNARKLLVVAFAVLICLILSGAVVAEGPKKIAEYRGVAANTSAFGMQGIVPITFEFYYWTSQDTMNQLGAALAKGGQDALLAELQKIDNPAGYMRTPESLAIKLRTATRTVIVAVRSLIAKDSGVRM
jgi:hypothetical protein